MTPNPISLLRRTHDGDLIYDCLMFVCPGCLEMDAGSGLHMLPVKGDTGGKPRWDWNGDTELPTTSPSILTKYIVGNNETKICHGYLEAGAMRFLEDCTHSLAGTTVPIPELQDWMIH